MERLSAWKMFKITSAVTAGIGIGKLLVHSAELAFVKYIKDKHPEIYEAATNKKNEE